ncbi:MAG: SDR family NAD(P)-dependent oxidoreductase [Rhodobacteraceae bacterium]|nr:SDR family NAD(P)-dependent oxidoreductase [Paracoccaceae bacterium]
MKVVLLTGAGSGVGARAALAHLAAGDHVFATTHRPGQGAALRETAGDGAGRLVTFALDVTDPQAVGAAIARVITEAGRIDVVSSIAGISAVGALEDCDDALYTRLWEVNCLGPLRLARAALPHMRAAGGGRLVFMSSMAGRVPVPGESAYAASKHALEGAVESLSFELARWGVRVGLVEASYHRTPIGQKVATPVLRPGSAYAPLMTHLATLAASTIAAAPDPAPLAEALVRLAHDPDPPLRLVVGARAQALAEARAAGSDADLAQATEDRMRMRWWREGGGPP